DAPRPTPLLSYMVRHFSTAAGVMITASHNPPNYNGFKIYNESGGQMTEEMANAISKELEKIDNELLLPSGSIDPFVENNQIIKVGKQIDNDYLKDLEKDLIYPELFEESQDYKIVYSPLHGAGLNLINEAVNLFKFNGLHVVKEQTTTTGAFETIKY